MSTSGDRHLGPDPAGLLPSAAAGDGHVTVVAEPAFAATFAGQALLRMLVDLLARQFSVLERVELDVPRLPAISRATGAVAGEDLETALLRVGSAAGGSEISVTRAGSTAEHVIFVGPGSPSRAGALSTISAVANSWLATISDDPVAAQVDLDELPFGPHLAAAIASDRLFRGLHGVGVTGTSHIELLAAPELAIIRERLSGFRLPPCYVIGLGAVGAAFLLTLGATGIPATVVGLDPDDSDTTSRNRLLSMGYEQVGIPKPQLAAVLVKGTELDFYPNEVAWPAYYGDPDRRRPKYLAAQEAKYRYEWVISAVDKNLHRRNIANILPLHVLSGATNGFVAQAAYMAMVGDCECLACNHPVPSFDLDATRDGLASVGAEERVAQLRAMGASDADVVAIETYLDDPACGAIGEATLRRLGVDGGVDWAVGFVSAASGALLAAQFVRAAILGAESGTSVGAERRLIFWGTPELIDSLARRRTSCPVCGDVERQQAFATRWDGL
ncbi:MAG: ThiF family adenylyltransferase [Chloroflexi bacterium]|nr:ThiF family adenylyltransferase [Chloroflexota bacterium]